MSESGPLNERMARVEEKTDNITRLITDLNSKLDNFIESAPDRYSAKWVERGLTWVITIVIGAVLMALIALVINKP